MKYSQWVDGELEEIEELKFSEANYLGSQDFGEKLRLLVDNPRAY